MSKIPTAQEFLSENIDRTHFPFIDEAIEDKQGDAITILQCMQEFAKLHVKAALEAAAKNSDIVCKKSIGKSSSWICKRCASGGCEESIINKESILNAYPDGNIK